MLDPWLESKGLVDANQVLANFAVSKLGEPPGGGITGPNPGGPTAAFWQLGSSCGCPPAKWRTYLQGAVVSICFISSSFH